MTSPSPCSGCSPPPRPLTVEDLATLVATSEPPPPALKHRIRRLVTVDAGRSLQPVGPGTGRRYQFAHTSLLQRAQADEDLRDPDFRTRIHTWARAWQNAGWPTSSPAAADGLDTAAATPRYLLGEYLTTLADDPRRQQELAGDTQWSVAAIEVHGVDRVLAQLRPAAAVGGNDSPAGVLHAAIRAQPTTSAALGPLAP